MEEPISFTGRMEETMSIVDLLEKVDKSWYDVL